jgi:hypothetical protein
VIRVVTACGIVGTIGITVFQTGPVPLLLAGALLVWRAGPADRLDHELTPAAR